MTPTPQGTPELDQFIKALQGSTQTQHALALSGAAQANPIQTSALSNTQVNAQGLPVGTDNSRVLQAASSFMGMPYKWGGNGAQDGGVDCSGLVQQAFSKLGINLPRTSQEMAKATQAINPADAKPGDLVFYDIPGEGTNSHVGIYAGNGKMIDAAHTGTTVREEPLWNGAKFGRVG